MQASIALDEVRREARAFEGRVAPARRKALGQFFTGMRVGRLLAHLAVGSDTRDVLDPMAGSGDLLDSAHEAALARGARLRRLDAVEIDEASAEICERRLLGLGGAVSGRAQVECGDAFAPGTLDMFPPGPRDLVIANPPYVRYQALNGRGADIRHGLMEIVNRRLLGRSREVWTALASGYSGLADLSIPSWLLCGLMVRPGGRLALVVPATWRSRAYADVVRYLLLRCFDLEHVVEDARPGWFPDALVRVQLVIARRLPDERLDERLGSRSDWPVARWWRVEPEAGGPRSLVEGAFPGETPEARFAKWCRSGRRRPVRGVTEREFSLEGEWRALRDEAGGRSWFKALEGAEGSAVSLDFGPGAPERAGRPKRIAHGGPEEDACVGEAAVRAQAANAARSTEEATLRASTVAGGAEASGGSRAPRASRAPGTVGASQDVRAIGEGRVSASSANSSREPVCGQRGTASRSPRLARPLPHARPESDSPVEPSDRSALAAPAVPADRAGPAVPDALRDLLPPGFDGRGLQRMSDAGIRVGQGLRTGCNGFFYVTLAGGNCGPETADRTGSRGLVRVVTSPALGGQTLRVPGWALQPVLHRQADLARWAEGVLPDTRVLDLRRAALPEDLEAVRETSGWGDPLADGAIAAGPRTMPKGLAEHVRKSAAVSLGRNGRDDGVPISSMSAVRTNARPARRGSPPRFWYMLPDFAPRHLPHAFVARVIDREPRVWANRESPILVDANFATFWAERGDWTGAGVAALLNNPWCRACMEAIGVPFGGGALKLEAARLRHLPIPRLRDGSRAELNDDPRDGCCRGRGRRKGSGDAGTGSGRRQTECGANGPGPGAEDRRVLGVILGDVVSDREIDAFAASLEARRAAMAERRRRPA